MVSGTNPALRQFQLNIQHTVYGDTKPGYCVECKAQFSPDNTHSLAGWKETKISGLCENCWDKLFDE